MVRHPVVPPAQALALSKLMLHWGLLWSQGAKLPAVRVGVPCTLGVPSYSRVNELPALTVMLRGVIVNLGPSTVTDTSLKLPPVPEPTTLWV